MAAHRAVARGLLFLGHVPDCVPCRFWGCLATACPYHRSSLVEVVNRIKSMFDRSDSSVRAKHDLVFNAALFSAVVFAFHKFGHKLAV